MKLADLRKTVKNILPFSVIERLQLLKNAGKTLPDYDFYQSLFRNKNGIEIGGPSTLFKTVLPIYPVVANLDGANFSSSTVWEGNIEKGQTFHYYKDKLGNQYVCDATDLSAIEASKYDFVLSSNCLEHVANPIKALKEFDRILRPDGLLLLVLPNKENNFDHNRPITTFDHLLDDYSNETKEDDLTHLEEILALHDLSMDPPAGTLEEFRTRSLNNFNNRTLHHHVFSIELLTQLLEHLSFEVIRTATSPHDLFVLGRK